jgi:protein-disulfide isomerase
MILRTALLALSLAAAAPGRAADAPLPPGVEAGALTAPQREVLARVLADSYCYCGCPHTLAGCLKDHRSCRHAPRMAELAVKLAATGAAAPDVQKFLTDYYAGFARRRATFNVKDFGPPLGKPDAPVTIVEFSDFTCPFCRMLRPRLEKWVKAREGRVKLHYKPFPIPSHARAMEAAEAAEWSREKGFFWQMHDLLFENPTALSDGDLAGYARRLGGSPDELREALASKRFRPRIFAAQAEARAAGLTGTPTLYLNGRRHVLTFGTREDPLANVEWGLDFALADEEEWAKNGGAWSKDQP